MASGAAAVVPAQPARSSSRRARCGRACSCGDSGCPCSRLAAPSRNSQPSFDELFDVTPVSPWPETERRRSRRAAEPAADVQPAGIQPAAMRPAGVRQPQWQPAEPPQAVRPTPPAPAFTPQLPATATALPAAAARRDTRSSTRDSTAPPALYQRHPRNRFNPQHPPHFPQRLPLLPGPSRPPPGVTATRPSLCHVSMMRLPRWRRAGSTRCSPTSTVDDDEPEAGRGRAGRSARAERAPKKPKRVSAKAAKAAKAKPSRSSATSLAESAQALAVTANTTAAAATTTAFGTATPAVAAASVPPAVNAPKRDPGRRCRERDPGCRTAAAAVPEPDPGRAQRPGFGRLRRLRRGDRRSRRGVDSLDPHRGRRRPRPVRLLVRGRLRGTGIAAGPF